MTPNTTPHEEPRGRSSDLSSADRTELERLRAELLLARREAEQARAERDRMLRQIREANETLLLATVEAHQQADVATSAAGDIEDRFRALVRASAAVVWQADARGTIEVDRERWKAFTGLEVTDQGEWWLDAIHPSERMYFRTGWSRAVATGAPFACQHRLRKHDGEYATMLSRAIPIPALAGAVREWIGMMTDISDSVRLDEAREQFIGILGHDLRNPLAAIVAGVDLLQGLPQAQAQVVVRMARSADRMRVIIRDVMDFALGRFGGGIPLCRRACDIGQICVDLVDEMQQAHPDRKFTCSNSGRLSGSWDPDRVEQALSNLLGNAIAYGTDPISVVARDYDDEILLTVHNHGKPIPADAIPTLFEPFARGQRERQRSYPQGLGLGLFIVKQIVGSHGGTVSVSSSQADGTTLITRWPRVDRAA